MSKEISQLQIDIKVEMPKGISDMLRKDQELLLTLSLKDMEKFRDHNLQATERLVSMMEEELRMITWSLLKRIESQAAQCM